MAKTRRKRRTTVENDEFEYECGGCGHSVFVGDKESFSSLCDKCGFTGFNMYRLEDEAEMKIREEYELKMAELREREAEIAAEKEAVEVEQKEE